MTLQHSRHDQRRFIENQLPESMGDCGLQRTQYEHARRMYESALNCDAEDSGVQRYIASALWCLGRTYHQLGDIQPSYDHLQEAYQLFNTLPPDEVELQRLSGQCGIDLVNAARMALPVGHKVGFPWPRMLKRSAPPFRMTSYMDAVWCNSGPFCAGSTTTGGLALLGPGSDHVEGRGEHSQPC
jgi:tetratricopeptide (TPR) repeat protein